MLKKKKKRCHVIPTYLDNGSSVRIRYLPPPASPLLRSFLDFHTYSPIKLFFPRRLSSLFYFHLARSSTLHRHSLFLSFPVRLSTIARWRCSPRKSTLSLWPVGLRRQREQPPPPPPRVDSKGNPPRFESEDSYRRLDCSPSLSAVLFPVGSSYRSKVR